MSISNLIKILLLIFLFVYCTHGCSTINVKYKFVAPDKYILSDGENTLEFTVKNAPCKNIEMLMMSIKRGIDKHVVEWPKIAYDKDYREYIIGIICARLQNI